jgi:hypothetical protein
MKLTKKYLQQIIRKEINTMFNEGHEAHGPGSYETWSMGLGPGAPGSAAYPLSDVAELDIRELLDLYRTDCSSNSTDIWCQLAKERIQNELGPG